MGPNKGLKVNQYKVCQHKLKLEEARTPEQRQVGLMFRKGIEKGAGMLFVFEQEQPLSFWMKNVPFDIEIGYFDKKGNFLNYHLMKGTSPLMNDAAQKTYPSLGEAKYAVEVSPGFFANANLKKCTLEPVPN